MPRKKLTEKQRRVVEEKEKQIRYARQQNSIHRLSIPQMKSDSEDDLEMDSPRKANDGLHMAHEHPVITRDMQMPAQKSFSKQRSADKRKENEMRIKGWNMTGELSNIIQENSRVRHEREKNAMGQILSIERIPAKDGQKDQDFFEKRKFSQAGSESFHLYSKQEL